MRDRAPASPAAQYPLLAAPAFMLMAHSALDSSVLASEAPSRSSSYRAPPAALASISLSHLTSDQQTQFRALADEFADIFAEDSNFFGRTSVLQHRIRMYK